MLIKHAHDLHIAKPYGCFLLFIVLTSTVASDPTDHTSPLKGCPTMVPAPPYSPNIFHLTLASPPWGLLFGSPFPWALNLEKPRAQSVPFFFHSFLTALESDCGFKFADNFKNVFIYKATTSHLSTSPPRGLTNISILTCLEKSYWHPPPPPLFALQSRLSISENGITFTLFILESSLAHPIPTQSGGPIQ